MNCEVICGLDVASTSARAALYRRDATLLHELDLPATRAGEDALLAKLPPTSAVFMESTGRYHLRWARRLATAGHRVYVLNAALAKRLPCAANALRQNKTDPIDARQLGRLGCLHGDAPEVQTYLFAESPERQRLRQLCEVRARHSAMRRELLAMVQHYVGTILPEADTLALDFAHCQALSALFLQIQSLRQLRGMRLATLERFAHSKAAALHALLREPLSAENLFDALLPALQANLRLLRDLNVRLHDLLVQIRATVRRSRQRREVELVQSIPGFGEKTAPAIVACLPHNWRQWGDKRTIAAKLQAFFGFDPRLRESGKWQGRVRMSKRGVVLARLALFQVATCALLQDAELHATYALKKAEGKVHRVAVSHVMRRQLRRLVAVLVNDVPFVEHHTPPQPAIP
jgi:transposase